MPVFTAVRQLLDPGSKCCTERVRGRQSGVGEGVGGVEPRRQLPYRTHQGVLQGRHPRSTRGDARGEALFHLRQLPGAHPRLPNPQELHQALRPEVRQNARRCAKLPQQRRFTVSTGAVLGRQSGSVCRPIACHLLSFRELRLVVDCR